MKNTPDSVARIEEKAQLAHIQERLNSQLIRTLDSLMKAQDESKLALVRETADQVGKMLDLAAQGRRVAIVPLDEELSTQEAADLLNVSRPFLVKLLESGEIPFHKVGSHRRVDPHDLLKYKAADDQRRETAADELTRQGQDLNLGY